MNFSLTIGIINRPFNREVRQIGPCFKEALRVIDLSGGLPQTPPKDYSPFGNPGVSGI